MRKRTPHYKPAIQVNRNNNDDDDDERKNAKALRALER